MLEIEILLSKHTTQYKKLFAATHIINTYNLPLSEWEIMTFLKHVTKEISCHGSVIEEYFRMYMFLFVTLLNTNKNIFIAIIKSRIDSNLFLVDTGNTYSIGYNNQYHTEPAYKIFCQLLNYYDFNVDDLIIDDEDKLLIQQYRRKKYGGVLAKVAV